jgi:hypothetical protein
MGMFGSIGQWLWPVWGGVAGLSQLQQGTAANTSTNQLFGSAMTSFATQQFPYYGSMTTGGPFMNQQWGYGKKIHHTTPSADAFKSLTAYIRKLLACEENCECKWCGATELERQVAIAQFFKEEPVEEAVAAK